MSVLSEPTKNFINWGFDIWNKGSEKVWSMLCMDPSEVGQLSVENGGEVVSTGASIWQTMETTVQPIMVGVGTALVGIFFFWGWVKNSVDVKDDMRLEHIVRMLIRLCLAEFLVINNFNIMKAFLTAGTNLVRAINKPEWSQMSLGDEMSRAIDGYNFFHCLFAMALTVLFIVVVAVLTIMLIMTVVNRFLKIFIAIPLGTLAFSTFAGDREIAHSSSSYLKYAAGLAVEGAAIGLALIASAQIISTLHLFGTGSIVLFFVEKIFQIAATLGVVKGIQEIVSRVFGI